MRTVVLIHGVLRGMGHEAACEMLALRETHPETRRPTYSRCSVLNASSELPDGEYRVHFDNTIVLVRREGGLWLPDGAQLTDAA